MHIVSLVTVALSIVAELAITFFFLILALDFQFVNRVQLTFCTSNSCWFFVKKDLTWS